jgi:hypothetical protein
MSLDLESLLRDWPHEPGQIKVRKIVGDDGAEKLQMRLDLGLIQMNMTGRPDGLRPFDCESLLAYHRSRAAGHLASGDPYALSDEECSEIQQEAIQYYHRYVALFQLGEYHGVIRDTEHNLALFDLLEKHSDRDESVHSLQQVRPYVIMMNTRAKASLDLKAADYAGAVSRIEAGIAEIEQFYVAHGSPEQVEKSHEIAFLTEWLDEVREKRPRSRIEELQQKMDEAIAAEAYERAAEIRDAIREFRKTP